MAELSYETLLENFFNLSKRQLAACLPNEPLAKLGTGQKGAVLNYDLPQSTTFKVKGYIPLDIVGDYFKANEKQEPTNHFWKNLETYTKDDLKVLLEVSAKTNVGSGANTFQNLVEENVNVDAGELSRNVGEDTETADTPPLSPIAL